MAKKKNLAKKASSGDTPVKLPEFKVQPVLTKSGTNTDWSHEFYRIVEAHNLGYRGAGVKVAILDTGVNIDHPSFSKAIGSGRLVALDGREGQNNPYDQNGHGCVTPNSIVFTSLCGMNTIETFFDRVKEFSVVDFGVMSEGSTTYQLTKNINTISWDGKDFVKSKITHAHKFPHKGELVVVETAENTLELTPWHPIYVVSSTRGTELTVIKKRADELKEGDKILCANGIDLNEGNYRFIGDTILDEELAYFAGLVASDGHIQRSKGVIKFSNNDTLLTEEFNRLCGELFSRNTKNKVRNNTTELVLYSSYACDLLMELGIPSGKKSLTLELPELVTKSPLSVIKAFYSGMIDGDGSIDKKSGKIRIISGSSDFCQGTSNLMKLLGYNSSWHINSTKGFKGKGESTTYAVTIPNLEFNLKGYKKNITISRKPYTRRSRPIISIYKKQYEGDMYDFTVDKTANYISNGGYIVSNTWCVSRIVSDGVDVLGFAPDATVFSIKVLGSNGGGVLSDIYRGVDLALANGADIVSTSLGWGSEWPHFEGVVKRVKDAGALFLSAAGNDGTHEGIDYPALYDDVISVGSHNQHLKRSVFSDWGADLDIYGSGEGVKGAWLGNKEGILQGTSMATPSVAGIIAMLRDKIIAKYPIIHRETLKIIATCQK